MNISEISGTMVSDPSTATNQIIVDTGDGLQRAVATSVVSGTIVSGDSIETTDCIVDTGSGLQRAIKTAGGGGGGSSGKYSLLERISDDSNNEIGTVSGFFTDANDVEYAVVCLDAQYRNYSTKWCSERNTVTNMPTYNNNYNLWWYDNAMETATQNTQLILDYCSAGSFTSTACTHCRSQSFTIDGTTYYGQLPNMRELFDMWRHRVQIEQMDTSASSHSSTNFSSSRNIWSSSQCGSSTSWCLTVNGCVVDNKAYTHFACPVLEIPN